jgi:ribosomal protein S18 acetylase RimI-like enzyme
MLLTEAVETEYGPVVELVNLAYRGSGAERSWNTEAGIVEGTRLTETLLREDLAAKPEARLLTYRDGVAGPLLGTVWLEPKGEGVWYLGLLTVRPGLQNRQMGRALLEAAEEYVRERDGGCVRMRVVWVREALIEWYRRRGYRLTGEREPFPYGDERFGRPLRDDLYFVVMEKELKAS